MVSNGQTSTQIWQLMQTEMSMSNASGAIKNTDASIPHQLCPIAPHHSRLVLLFFMLGADVVTMQGGARRC
jgi:hypothetical protein